MEWWAGNPLNWGSNASYLGLHSSRTPDQYAYASRPHGGGVARRNPGGSSFSGDLLRQRSGADTCCVPVSSWNRPASLVWSHWTTIFREHEGANVQSNSPKG